MVGSNSASLQGFVSRHRGRAEGGTAYKGQVPEDHSLLYSLMNARRKDDGHPLSDLHICAQAFTFLLAGKQDNVIRMLSCCMRVMQSHPSGGNDEQQSTQHQTVTNCQPGLLHTKSQTAENGLLSD